MKKITLFLVLISYVTFAQQYTYIDFGVTTNTTPGNWNNIAIAAAADASGITSALIDSNGSSTGVILTIDDAFDTVNTAGNATPDTSLPFPSSAAADSFFGESSDFQGTLEPTGGFVLTGLDPTKYYSFSIFTSRNNVTDNREALYTITGSTVKSGSLNPSNNTTETSDIMDVQSNASGEITFRAEPGTNNTNGTGFYYLGAIEITKTDAPLSLEDFELKNSLVIYPNPSTDKFSVSFKMLQSSKVDISMFNINGKKVASIFNDDITAGAFEYTWNRSSNEDIAAGLYILEVNAGGRKISKKLVLK